MSESIRYREIYEALKSEILGGKYVPARSFPSSTALARRFKTARATIRRALDQLRSQGLIAAGMDIVKVRENFPKLKIIGGYNRLRIAEGPEAIDREFERLLPIVRQGGYIVGADHQVPPSASLENYRYYVKRLGEAMVQCGKDIG